MLANRILISITVRKKMVAIPSISASNSSKSEELETDTMKTENGYRS